jgi:hypothetical protein
MGTTCIRSETALVERIGDGDGVLAVLIRREYEPEETSFLTPPSFKQQLGFIVYGAGSEIQRHEHSRLERSILGSSECLLVRQGLSEVTIYNRSREEVCRRMVREGDILLLVDGGHHFRQIEDTVFIEIKQGPYIGAEEKERF